MDYFKMSQDRRVRGAAQPIDMDALHRLSKEELDAVPSLNYYISGSVGVSYPDYIDYPVKLVSEKLKKIMVKYQKDALMKTVVLIEKEKQRQKIYYYILPPQLDCAAENNNMAADDDRLVLDQEKIGSSRIFQVVGKRQDLIVRLDVAESILRRNPNGVWFEKVLTAQKVRDGGI